MIKAIVIIVIFVYLIFLGVLGGRGILFMSVRHGFWWISILPVFITVILVLVMGTMNWALRDNWRGESNDNPTRFKKRANGNRNS